MFTRRSFQCIPETLRELGTEIAAAGHSPSRPIVKSLLLITHGGIVVVHHGVSMGRADRNRRLLHRRRILRGRVVSWLITTTTGSNEFADRVGTLI